MKRDKFFMSPLIRSFSTQLSADFEKESIIKYHYTSPTAFLLILKNKKIRFSDIRFMNDKSEGIYFVKVLLEYLEKNIRKHFIAREVLNTLIDQNSYEAIKSLTATSIKYNDLPGAPYESSRSFLFCAADQPDLLNMWNYYIRNNTYEGYSIGFNTGKLLKTFDTDVRLRSDPFLVYYGDVLYDEKKQQQEIEDLLYYVEGIADLGVSDSYTGAAIVLRQYIETRGYFFKHKSFAAEKEYRILVSISEGRIKKDKSSWLSNMKDVEEDFFVRNGLIVPCFSILIPDDAISRIYLSPMVEDEIAKAGVRELVDMTGFKNVQIWKSNIPIRY